MILKLIMQKEDMNGMRVTYQLKDMSTSKSVATATNNFKEWVTLYYEDNKYEFCTYPKVIVKPQINIKYPLSSKRKKMLGFRIIENDDCVAAKYYGDAATVKKIGFLKRNIGLTVYEYQQEPYMLYKVGFRNESSHYYCLYNNYGETVAIIERHPVRKDNSKAMIYIEDDEHILIALFVCTAEIILVGGSGNFDDRDLSAGNYISLHKEEKAMLDRSFLGRVIENDLPGLAEDLKTSGRWTNLFSNIE